MIADSLLAVGGGLMTASWGGFKDTPYEGFSILSFLRSIVITAYFYFLLVSILVFVDGHAGSVMIVFAAVAFERITQEFWKAFFRRKHREEIYKIPQSFHVLGKVARFRIRFLIGLVLSAAFLSAAYFLARTRFSGNSWILIGLAAAVVPSVGGAWKDAPIEGFDIKKFPRSFIVMFAAMALLHFFTDNLLLLFMGAAGLERVLVEFYKTFIVLSTPGKFFEKVSHKKWLTGRRVFVYSYILAWVMIAFGGYLSVLGV